MKKTITPLVELNSNNNKVIELNPKKSTLDFIKQFARVYSFEHKLPIKLGNMIAN